MIENHQLKSILKLIEDFLSKWRLDFSVNKLTWNDLSNILTSKYDLLVLMKTDVTSGHFA